jgi:hypothetical protein
MILDITMCGPHHPNGALHPNARGASNALFVLSKSCTFMVDNARDAPYPWTSHRGGAHARLVNPGEAATSPQQAPATGQRRREVEEDPNL